MNITIFDLPSELSYKILEQTSFNPAVKYVCTAFATGFFATLFSKYKEAGCQCLRKRIEQVECKHTDFSSSQKVKAIYSSFVKDMVDMGWVVCVTLKDLDQTVKTDKDIVYFTTNHALENLNEIDDILNDINLIALYEQTWPYLVNKEKYFKDLALEIKMGFVSQLSEKEATDEAKSGTLACPDLEVKNINKLPREISLFSQLDKLVIKGDKVFLQYLPAEMNKLTNLETLILDGQQLTSIPKEVLQLPKLTKLSLKGNPIANRKEIEETKNPKCTVIFD